MKKPITPSAGRPGSIGASGQKLSMPFVLSVTGHLVFCLLFIGLPKFGTESKMSSRIINVQLVSASAPLPASSAPAPKPKASAPDVAASAVVEAPKPKPTVSTSQKPKEAVSLAPKEIEKKQSMKKQTYKRERVLESAIKSVEKRVETATKPDPIRQALDRIQAGLKENEQQAAKGDSGAAGASGVSSKGQPTSDIQNIYSAEVAVYIQKNWAFSEQMAGGEKNLYNEVGFKIMRNGEIKDIWFDRRSGNSYFDESARKAILKSSPLPPLPDEIKGAYYELGARFTPEGIN